jgi:hypothetical protein
MRFTLFILIVLIVLFHIMSQKRIIIDLNKNYEDISILSIKNLDEILSESQLKEDVIDIRESIPSSIKVKVIPGKGYGLVAMKDIKKDELIHITPIRCFHKSKSEKIQIITDLGKTDVIPSKHCDGRFKDYILFDNWDIFLNHDINNNAYFSTLITYKNGTLHQTLYARRDIKKGDEITINYIVLYLIVNYFTKYYSLLDYLE